MTASKPLAGLRVLDFAWIGAGALVTKALGELGAEVIRIESRARPDNLRQSPPFPPGVRNLDASGYFASRNPGKKSVALNMKHPGARAIAMTLAEQSDVFASNFRTGVLERWGMGYDDVREVNSRIVYLTMPMQGREGPHRNYVGFGSTIAALAGLVHTTAVPGRAPIGTGTHYPDHVPNPGHALVALLAAIYHQQRTGEGQYVELSQLESTVNVVGHGILQSSIGGDVRPSGNRLPGCAPRGVYRCASGEWLAISCRSDHHWDAMAKELGRPEWLTDSKFATVYDRIEHADQLDAELAATLESVSRSAVVDKLVAAGVPAGPVNSAKDMLNDPHLVEREFWQPVQHRVIGEIPMSHLPFRIGSGPRPTMTPPPLLGEHTREVATTLLGMTDGQYEELAADGLFY
ncbi:CoA transferase [Mycolicibacterium litorale]|uniref:CoA transferase n=1 Tax=Mycolicibacterium litorale TaxID=758802 RepID=A0A6S6P667_9MYCO|nr:CoA transferase [Mycolicibacterium litorale]BCI51788.1 CoA transferase [Mycolicibacterium litorale]